MFNKKVDKGRIAHVESPETTRSWNTKAFQGLLVTHRVDFQRGRTRFEEEVDERFDQQVIHAAGDQSDYLEEIAFTLQSTIQKNWRRQVLSS